MGNDNSFAVSQDDDIEGIKKYLRENNSGSIIENALCKLGQIVPDELLPILASIAPLSASIFTGLNAFNSRRERDNIEDALARAMVVLQKHSSMIKRCMDQCSDEYIKAQLFLYLEHSMRARQRDKIELFCNIWANSMINPIHNLEEEEYIIYLIASMRLEEISVLKIVYAKFSLDSPPFVDISEIARALNIDLAHAQQICIALQGKGLLHPDTSMEPMAGNFVPTRFATNEYVRILVEHIMEPRFDANTYAI